MLEGLNLELPRGTSTAVVGRSGAGKSTIASLLSRFYEPDKGTRLPKCMAGWVLQHKWQQGQQLPRT